MMKLSENNVAIRGSRNMDSWPSSAIEYSLAELEHAIKDEGTKKYLIKLGLLAAIYVATAMLGFSLSFNFEQITTIWAPTGIAISALLLWGYHYWPAVFVGAFIANALSGPSFAVATGIGFGNTLEAVVAVVLIKRFVDGGRILDKISGTLAYVILVCFFSTILSATFGVGSLILGDNIENSQLGEAWLTWWVGDMMGALIIVPLVVAWKTDHYREQLATHVYEAIALLLLIIMSSLIIFSQPSGTLSTTFPLVYLIFPLVMAAAVRFTQIGAATAGTVVALAALWGTLSGTGPYANLGSTGNSLFALHFFILVVMVTALVLSVAVYGRIRSEQALVKQTMELQAAKKVAMRNVEWRKDLEEQMEEATGQINDILTGVFQNNQNIKQPKKKL